LRAREDGRTLPRMAATGREAGSPPRAITYCVIPRELAPKLHEQLRRHFADTETVEVVVERRRFERRADDDRRTSTDAAPTPERRAIRGQGGRRVGARRAA